MYQKIITLRENEFIVVEWLEGWKHLTIKKDGMLIGSVGSEEELQGGRNFRLPNGKTIMVVLADYGLEVWYEGVEVVSGTKSGAIDSFGSGFNALVSTGAINLFIAFFMFMVNRTVISHYVNIVLVVFGIAMIGLGIYARKVNTKSPYWAGLVIGFVNFVLMLLQSNYIGMGASGYLVTAMRNGINSKPYQPTRKITLDEDAPLDSGI